MFKKNTSIILKFVGICIMLIAFFIVPDSKPWYYEVLLFDVGLIITIIPKFPKLKKNSRK